jgi:hypothetical protein
VDEPRERQESRWPAAQKALLERLEARRRCRGGDEKSHGAARGTEVEDRVISTTHGTEGEAEVIMAARGMGEGVKVVGRATDPLGWRLDRQHVQRIRLDHLEARLDYQPLQRGRSESLVARSYLLVESRCRR